jgi:hypothetical protein
MTTNEGTLSLVDQLDVVVVPESRPAQQYDEEGTSSISITISVTVSLTAFRER